ncbi:glycosyltransferase family 4 protein [Chryseobacterium sp. BIGb0232]|uniref:glycosyltransferase family 4 protein n=1 Tax=Chryseobacterium sp. BIGb0232 TaxID=2940598 RepID=UPI000F49D062|nr:glycosyltransferase [Chryseobacterium sp. BIGb0232]MCS4302434.1 glycosyltransferase involved in cell wall biosynthesis [Chryseobacterium sp. BIGb0232]ROS18377.1 glycosyltransferase involved in cell wall biosynthesis [Chryseobacterium nakagawai]
MITKQTILATCYAVNPYKGSEDAMGWNFVYQIARFRNVIAITRENNRPHIEKFMSENPDSVYKNIQFLYFDLPYWMRFWKKGSRGAMLYYYLWQKGIISFIKKQNLNFDIVHNVNFHNDWTPSFLWELKKPMVWGPVGHHPLIPEQYLKDYSKKYLIKDRLTWIVKNFFWKFSPSLKKTAKYSNHIWCMNSGVPEKLKINENQYSIYPSVASEDFYVKNEILPKSDFTAISVGRFVPLKGFDLTIRSFTTFFNQLSEKDKSICKLVLVGTGEQKNFYEDLIKQNNMQNYIEIIEWIDRRELMKLYDRSSVFLFPSHEGAGMVVPEALSFGLPVVCLKNEGPGEFINHKCGFTVPQQEYSETVNGLSTALFRLFSEKNLFKEMSIGARNLYMERFSWEKRGEHLNQIYNKL